MPEPFTSFIHHHHTRPTEFPMMPLIGPLHLVDRVSCGCTPSVHGCVHPGAYMTTHPLHNSVRGGASLHPSLFSGTYRRCHGSASVELAHAFLFEHLTFQATAHPLRRLATTTFSFFLGLFFGCPRCRRYISSLPLSHLFFYYSWSQHHGHQDGVICFLLLHSCRVALARVTSCCGHLRMCLWGWKSSWTYSL